MYIINWRAEFGKWRVNQCFIVVRFVATFINNLSLSFNWNNKKNSLSNFSICSKISTRNESHCCFSRWREEKRKFSSKKKEIQKPSVENLIGSDCFRRKRSVGLENHLERAKSINDLVRCQEKREKKSDKTSRTSINVNDVCFLDVFSLTTVFSSFPLRK